MSMDRKKSDSYDEIHAMLVEAMQDACANEESGDYELPNIVPGYVYNKYNAKISVSRFSRFSKVAAVFVIVLLGMNLFVLTSDSSEAYGDKGLLHRIFEGSRGIFTDNDNSQYVDIDESCADYTLTDFSEIEEAKEFWPDLCIPGYVPDGYEFKSLYISKSVSGDYIAEYEFVGLNESLDINMTYTNNDSKKCSMNKGQLFEYEDRIINLYSDEIYKLNIADVYFENITVHICTVIDTQELLNLAKNIYK